MSAKGALTSNSAQLPSRSDSFIQLFEADKRRIYAYIYAFVHDKDAADEIFQETSVLLWRDFDKFEADSNFSKWANGIVFNRVRSYRRLDKRFKLGLSDDLAEQVAATIAQSDPLGHESEKRWRALQACRALLPNTLQQLYCDFYIENASAPVVAERTGRSVFAIRKSVQKLRKKLFDCIDQKKREGLL
ncbi:sigma-70 family RNA polymerase sigma factor [Neiella sp. HB171785]|uniref:Sigma-70 family RNA polymerase sigma factor n=1 Tax=Neiella litorisoli TaxID=2771431 RepID=A0A8J6QHN4_9GAMM|nr:sigma-70 family RNA polymerase sigma factor [Neiella litorisoli]MBD1388677.1 sigma-70 family RNA polymerase sigma factor [Neiella litorisoli]